MHRTLGALASLMIALAGLSGIAGCGPEDADETPSDALSRFLEAMDRSSLHEAALKDAYALLDEQARHELTLRADRAGSLTGHRFEPWEMIAHGRFHFRISPAEH